jgi:N-acetyl-anhydromuramyl-L-alanine amidase AmpD
MKRHVLAMLTLVLLAGRGARAEEPGRPAAGAPLARVGDEIVACGQMFHTGTPVVLWLDPGGYDAYRVERRFVAPEEADWEASQKAGLKRPNRYGSRLARLEPAAAARVREQGWDLDTLRGVVDQFVIHYDVCGTSRKCFEVLHDERGLSVHFLLDADGTIYQTLDLKESAWHATKANTRSIGIEIAQIGAYPPGKSEVLDRWYARDGDGRVRLTLPERLRAPGFRNAQASLAPAREAAVVGTIQGSELRQYDFTPEQYEALAHLTAALCRVFPRIAPRYPVDGQGGLVPRKLPDAEWEAYGGLLGHFHVQANKTDPGPAFDWERLMRRAGELGAGPR